MALPFFRGLLVYCVVPFDLTIAMRKDAAIHGPSLPGSGILHQLVHRGAKRAKLWRLVVVAPGLQAVPRIAQLHAPSLGIGDIDGLAQCPSASRTGERPLLARSP
jgi:hypothetical protein